MSVCTRQKKVHVNRGQEKQALCTQGKIAGTVPTTQLSKRDDERGGGTVAVWNAGGDVAFAFLKIMQKSRNITSLSAFASSIFLSTWPAGGRVGVLTREHGTRVVDCAKYYLLIIAMLR